MAADAVFAQQLGAHFTREFGLCAGVDQHWVVAPVVHFGAQAKALGLRLGQCTDALLQQVAHAGVERPHAELQAGGVGDHVVGFAGVQLAHGDDGRLLRVDVARDHRLQRHHQAGRRHDGVGRVLRQGAVATRAVQRDGDVVRRRHEGPVMKHQLARSDAGHVVQGVHGVAVKALKQPLFNHQPRAAGVFFGGLKDQVQRARKTPVFGQVLCRHQQHGGVAVVAAGVHHAAVHTGPGVASGFMNGQRVHVSAQAQPLVARAPAQAAHHAGAGQATVHFITPGRQPLGHQGRGALLVQAELRMAVQVAPQCRELGRPGL